MKSCSYCGEFKPLKQFTHDRSHRTGYHHRCLACELIRTKERRRNGSLSIASKRWRNRNLAADKAHRILRAALRRGEIKRGPCCKCGATNAPHGHHGDYTKPLVVDWLCLHCHHEWHRLQRLGEFSQMKFFFMEGRP